eukprot:jgi/Chlat1/4174/Chrsp27S04276
MAARTAPGRSKAPGRPGEAVGSYPDLAVSLRMAARKHTAAHDEALRLLLAPDPYAAMDERGVDEARVLPGGPALHVPGLAKAYHLGPVQVWPIRPRMPGLLKPIARELQTVGRVINSLVDIINRPITYD